MCVLLKAQFEVNEVEVLVPHRVVRVRARLNPIGPIDFFSCYGRDQGCADSKNDDIYEKVAECVLRQGRPALLGGDWNQSPEKVASWYGDRVWRPVVLRAGRETCQAGDN